MSIQVGLVAIFVISKVPEKFLSAYELLHYFISNESAYIQYTGWTVIALPFAELLVSASYALTIFVLCYQVQLFYADFYVIIIIVLTNKLFRTRFSVLCSFANNL